METTRFSLLECKVNLGRPKFARIRALGVPTSTRTSSQSEAAPAAQNFETLKTWRDEKNMTHAWPIVWPVRARCSGGGRHEAAGARQAGGGVSALRI